MFVVLTRPEGQHVQITQPPKSLSDQLQDLTVKYEALEDKYNTTMLENTQYKQHIVDLYQQNDDLQQELQCYQQKMSTNQELEPMLTRHISMMETSITEKDEEMEELTNKLHESGKLIKTFKSEIMTMKQQNEKLRIALESGNQQKQILKQIHNDTISCKDNQICALQDELEALRQEFESMKSDGGKTPPSISLSADITPIPRMEWSVKTMENDIESPFDGLPAITLLTPRSNTLGTEFRKMSTDSAQNMQFAQFMQCQTPMVYMDNIAEDEYKQRLEILEAENAELMKKLEVMEKNGCIMDDVEDNDNDEVDDEEKNVMEDFDDDDIAEMEQLFEKCQVNSIEKSDHDLRNKYVNWFIWFEDQYKYVKISK